ncbi:MAG: PAS domain S-box protein [Halanaeroarchaeum sp.]
MPDDRQGGITLMEVPLWPLRTVDVLGSIALLAVTAMTIRQARVLASRRESAVVWSYLYWLSIAFGVFAGSRAVSHLLPYVLFRSGFADVWTMIAPVTGSLNTITFVTAAVLSLFYGRVSDQMARLREEVQRRREAQRELRAHREELESIVAERTERLRTFHQAVQYAGHAIYIADADGTIEYVNPAFEEITGYDAENALGSTPALLTLDSDHDDYVEDMWETINAGETWQGEVVHERASGGTYPAFQTMTPIVEDGSTVAYVCIQSDLSDRRALERDLQERNRQLTVLERVFRHNLRNAMNLIQGYASQVHETANGEAQTAATKILDASDALLTLVDKERTITELLADPPDRERVDVEQVVRSLVREANQQHDEASIEYAIREEVTAVATPNVDAAIAELIQNAIRHSDRKRPTVEITVTERDGGPRIGVADHGPGIPEMERAVLTDEAEIDQLYHGSGLGLWLVQLIVQQSGGSLSFQDNEPRGTVVSVDLPGA